LVFDYHHALGRQIKHLSTFHLQARYLAQVLLTVVAELNWVNQHYLGRKREQQAASWMIDLSPSLLAAFPAQTLGLQMKAVGGGWPVAVVAILVQAVLQFLYLLPEQRYLSLLQAHLLLQQADFLSQSSILFL
jgi:hypothetical protein